MKHSLLSLLVIVLMNGCGLPPDQASVNSSGDAKSESEAENITLEGNLKDPLDTPPTASDFSDDNAASFLDYPPERERTYHTQEGKMFFSSMEMLEVDVSTFEVLSDEYARDENSVYFREKKILSADPETFQILKDGYSRDTERVFLGGEFIPDADPDTFIILGEGYSKDANWVFFSFQKLSHADVKSFEIVDGAFARDAHHVFLGGDVLQDPDVRTFEAVSEENGTFFYRDQQNIYSPAGFTIVEGADPSTFRRVKHPYFVDHQQVYWFDGFADFIIKPIEGSSAIGFELLEGGFARDHESVFIWNIKIKGADPETFEPILDENGYDEHFGHPYSTDAETVYYGSMAILGADPETFEVISPYTARDQYREYDLNGFMAVKPIEQHSYFYTDGTNVYYWGSGEKMATMYQLILLENVNLEAFEVLPFGYARDGEQVFLGAYRVTDDLENFEILSEEFSKDSTDFYFYGRSISSLDPAVDRFEFDATTFAFGKEGGRVYFTNNGAVYEQSGFGFLEIRNATDKERIMSFVTRPEALNTAKQ